MPDPVDASDARAALRAHGFAVVRGAVLPEVCELATRYGLNHSQHLPEEEGHPSSRGAYGDPLTEGLVDMLWPAMERLVGEALWPTYSYYRVYLRGARLKPHTDRTACEISATLCAGSSYAGAPAGYEWPLWTQLRGSGEAAAHGCATSPGDMVVYRGCDVRHWRELFEGEWQVQIFLHYVRRQGPFAMARYDCRPGLGTPRSSRDPALLQRMLALDAFLDKERDPRDPA
jgi:hypothetical protein